MFNNDNERFLEDPKRHSDEDCQAHTEERRLCEWCNHMFPESQIEQVVFSKDDKVNYCQGCHPEALRYAVNELGHTPTEKKKTIAGVRQYASDDLSEEEKENAVVCECCKVWDLYELMKRMPEGCYCRSCWDSIYG